MANVTICGECRGTGIARSRLRSAPGDPAVGEDWYSLEDDLCPRCNGEGRRGRKTSLADQFNLPVLVAVGALNPAGIRSTLAPSASVIQGQDMLSSR